jgi:cyanophycinase-like exopeptidase
MPPGKIILFGSGETLPMGGQVFRTLAEEYGAGVTIAMLETPAGFQPNSAQVLDEVADLYRSRISHLRPVLHRIAARKKGTENSPDNADLVRPIMDANIVYLGAGSPTYAIRQLKDSLAWQYALAAWEQGAALMLASAAAIAIGAHALPVYEIFKVGDDLHWKDGLDLLGLCGVSGAVVPHWNNNDGGVELDTSRCFMGEERFRELCKMLPDAAIALGIDEHTVVELDVAAGRGQVMGAGKLTLQRGEEERIVSAGATFPLSIISGWSAPSIPSGIPDEIWQQVSISRGMNAEDAIPSGLIQLLHDRNQARMANDYARADALRKQIEEEGWDITDTKEGSQLRRWSNKSEPKK